MGTTSSSSRGVIPTAGPVEDSGESYLSLMLLCGASDAVDDKAQVPCGKRPAEESDAARAQASATRFMGEFKMMLKKQGFTGWYSSRPGRRPSLRVFRTDHDETMLTWDAAKTSINRDDFEHILFSEVTGVDKRDKSVTVHSVRRSIVVAFETDKRAHIFHDGLSLLVLATNNRPPRSPPRPPSDLESSSSSSSSSSDVGGRESGDGGGRESGDDDVPHTESATAR